MRPRILLIAALLGACAPSSANAPQEDDALNRQWRAIQLQVDRAEIGYPPDMLAGGGGGVLELGPSQIGRLVFRGGLALSGDRAIFGGLSGLELLEDGEILAVSDAGVWFSARLKLDDDGALIGLDAPRLAPMRDEHGAIFVRKVEGDAEDLAHLRDGRFAVSFEQTQTIRIYDLYRDGATASATRGPRLAERRRLPHNVGIEALTTDAGGALIVGAEGDGASARLWRAAIETQGAAPVLTRYRLTDGFALVGLDRLPDGGFVVLERAYGPLTGMRIRIAHFSAEALNGHGPIAAETWAELRAPLSLDNFEGVAATRGPQGGVRLYLVSDNNFSGGQRTLLYAFDVVDAAADNSARLR